MNNWEQLSKYLPSDEDRLKGYAQLQRSPYPDKNIIDPELIEMFARMAGYRGDLGVHPDTIDKGPALKLHMEDDAPIKKY